MPFSLIGGLVALLLTGIHLSVSAAIGFIALFGIAVQNGVILLWQINLLHLLRQEGVPCGMQSCRFPRRLCSVMIAALMAMPGLLLAALSTGVGSETIKPFAVVIIGGTGYCETSNLDHASRPLSHDRGMAYRKASS